MLANWCLQQKSKKKAKQGEIIHKKWSSSYDHEDSCWLFFFPKIFHQHWDSSRLELFGLMVNNRDTSRQVYLIFVQWLKYPSDPSQPIDPKYHSRTSPSSLLYIWTKWTLHVFCCKMARNTFLKNMVFDVFSDPIHLHFSKIQPGNGSTTLFRHRAISSKYKGHSKASSLKMVNNNSFRNSGSIHVSFKLAVMFVQFYVPKINNSNAHHARLMTFIFS